jgi:hypothetical protein
VQVGGCWGVSLAWPGLVLEAIHPPTSPSLELSLLFCIWGWGKGRKPTHFSQLGQDWVERKGKVPIPNSNLLGCFRGLRKTKKGIFQGRGNVAV